VNFHVFRITAGVFDGVDLRGAVFVVVNLPRAPRQQPVADTLFVRKEDEGKGSAIQMLLQRVFALTPRKVSTSSIEFHESRKKVQVKIPGLLLYKISFGRNQALHPDVSENLYPWLFDSRQGTVDAVSYSPENEKSVTYSNTNALSGTFRVAIPSPH